MLQQLIEFMFPFTCYSCGLLGKALCMKCFHQLRYEPSRRQLLVAGKDGEIFEVLSAHRYESESVIAKIIHAYKYQHARSLNKVLVPHMEECLKQLSYSYDWTKTILVPIPLHRKKQNERGYNQSEELCKALSKLTGIPYLPLLKRVRHHDSQAGISRKEDRLKNVKGVFEVDEKIKSSILNGNATNERWVICLVDDIVTTGATLMEARNVLAEDGFTQSFGLCLASREI